MSDAPTQTTLPAKTNGGPPGQMTTRKDKAATILDLFKTRTQAMSSILPKHLKPERLMNVAMFNIARTPKLLECTPESLLASLMRCSEYGLEPGPQGHIWLIPRWNNKSGKNECQAQIGKWGLQELAWRSGELEAPPRTSSVYSNDIFKETRGLEQNLIHEPCDLSQERGDFIGAYAVAQIKGASEKTFLFMSKADIDKRRAASQTGNSGPWVDWYAEMAEGTVLKALCKRLPMSSEKSLALKAKLSAEDSEDSLVGGDAFGDIGLLPTDANGALLEGAVADDPNAGRAAGPSAAELAAHAAAAAAAKANGGGAGAPPGAPKRGRPSKADIAAREAAALAASGASVAPAGTPAPVAPVTPPAPAAAAPMAPPPPAPPAETDLDAKLARLARAANFPESSVTFLVERFSKSSGGVGAAKAKLVEMFQTEDGIFQLDAIVAESDAGDGS